MRSRITAFMAIAACIFVGNSHAADRQLETRVAWSPHCSDEVDKGVASRSVFLGAVVAALAPKLIGGVVDSAATALKKAGERAELARSTGQAITRPYAVSSDADLGMSPEHGCLVIARGEFRATNDGTAPSSIGLELISSVSNPVAIFEAKIKMLAGEPYFQLVPYRLRVAKFEGASFWSPAEREYTFAVALSVPGAEKPFASPVFSFAGVSEGADLKLGSAQLAGKASQPLPLPPVPESGKKAQAVQEAFIAPYVLAGAVLTSRARPSPPRPDPAPNARRSEAVQSSIIALCAEIQQYNKLYPKTPLSDPLCANRVALARADVEGKISDAQSPDTLVAWATKVCPKPERDQDGSLACGLDIERPVKAKARFGHMVTDVTVVETRSGNRFAKYLGEALSASKDELTKAIAQQIVPAQAKAADAAEEAAERAARRGVVLADLAVTQAELTLAELQASSPSPSASSVTAARATLIKAKIAANDAYRAANLPVPFPDLD
jgi:hypothetical protein